MQQVMPRHCSEQTIVRKSWRAQGPDCGWREALGSSCCVAAVQRWPWLGAGSQTTSCTPNRGHQHTILCIPVFTHLHPGRGVEEELHHRGTDPTPLHAASLRAGQGAAAVWAAPRPSQAVPLKRKDVLGQTCLDSAASFLVAGKSS